VNLKELAAQIAEAKEKANTKGNAAKKLPDARPIYMYLWKGLKNIGSFSWILAITWMATGLPIMWVLEGERIKIESHHPPTRV